MAPERRVQVLFSPACLDSCLKNGGQNMQLDRACRADDRSWVARDFQRLRSAQTQSQALEATPAPELRPVRVGSPACVLLRCTVVQDVSLYAPARPQRHWGLRRTRG